MLAAAGGRGCSLWRGSAPVASALALPYDERFAWICMVLVSAGWRHRGIASALLGELLDRLQAEGLTAGLDATEAGRGVYRPLGFNDIYPVQRLFAAAACCRGAPPGPAGFGIAPLCADAIAALSDWDARTFGASRRAVLAALRQRLPGCALLARDGRGRTLGYILGRDGRAATQLGPLVAENDAVARALLDRARTMLDGPLLIDVAAPERRPHWLEHLQRLGFVRQRQFSRMLRGRDRPLDEPGRVYALAGPELG